MDLFKRYTSVTGVNLALGDQAEKGTCGGCGAKRVRCFPWPPLSGETRCAPCIVVQSGGQNA